jgi:hypothetical protein
MKTPTEKLSTNGFVIADLAAGSSQGQDVVIVYIGMKRVDLMLIMPRHVLSSVMAQEESNRFYSSAYTTERVMD